MVRRTLLIVLSPLLLMQALWVKWRTPRLPEPMGERSGELGDGPLLRLLILGDSAAAGVGVSAQHEALSGQLTRLLEPHYRLRWRLLAKSGMTTTQTLAWVEQEAAQADVVLISLGVNDLLSPIGVRRWLTATGALIDGLLASSPGAKVLLTPLPPLGAFPRFAQPLAGVLTRREAHFNQALMAFCQGRRACQLLPLQLPLTPEALASDGFHPSAASYRLWAECACRAIISLHRPS
ncbi:SGNH/GDSL hydrolase family protein [Shewanella insulae]|uniref:SGNH/GDSL hydrolase family protein n=1 Tax=Shewanella insulae TaxID=2681496 RepID=UPI001EFC69D5|nr:SGNH/GDSL hydrolase family protein [Shewanella insulae]MCG9738704.1 SGNH/GDSL hydrolase family protein [Shewanella insulae]